MAMTNAERQAKWREALKAKARAGVNGDDAFRAKLRGMFPRSWAAWGVTNENDVAKMNAARDAIFQMSDGALSDWLSHALVALHADKCREIEEAKPAVKPKRSKATTVSNKPPLVTAASTKAKGRRAAQVTDDEIKRDVDKAWSQWEPYLNVLPGKLHIFSPARRRQFFYDTIINALEKQEGLSRAQAEEAAPRYWAYAMSRLPEASRAEYSSIDESDGK